MPLSSDQAAKVVQEARKLIGKTYKELDCSHFVYEAYKQAGLEYPYHPTATFVELVGPKGLFDLVSGPDDKQEGDVILFSGHMGIWDPDGCSVVVPQREACKISDDDAPILSSRSGKNRGPDFGEIGWFGGTYKVYRWRGSAATAAPSAKGG